MSIHADAQSGFRHTFLPPPVVIPSLYSVAVFSSWRSPSVRASTSPPLPRVFSTPKRPGSLFPQTLLPRARPLRASRFPPKLRRCRAQRRASPFLLFSPIGSRGNAPFHSLPRSCRQTTRASPAGPGGGGSHRSVAPHASSQLGLRLRHGAKAIRRCRGRETIIGGGVTAMAGDAAGNAETSGGGRARR